MSYSILNCIEVRSVVIHPNKLLSVHLLLMFVLDIFISLVVVILERYCFKEGLLRLFHQHIHSTLLYLCLDGEAFFFVVVNMNSIGRE